MKSIGKQLRSVTSTSTARCATPSSSTRWAWSRSTIARVAEWQPAGFVDVGDFLGQLQPILDPRAGAVAHAADIDPQMARSQARAHHQLLLRRERGSKTQLNEVTHRRSSPADVLGACISTDAMHSPQEQLEEAVEQGHRHAAIDGGIIGSIGRLVAGGRWVGHQFAGSRRATARAFSGSGAKLHWCNAGVGTGGDVWLRRRHVVNEHRFCTRSTGVLELHIKAGALQTAA
jgi:uncharacterized protein YcfJ